MNYQNDFWKQYFRYYDILLKVIPYQELFESIVKHLDVKSGMTILDLGAGTGNLQYFLPNDVNVIGLDNSEEALKD
ncbi:MAG: methyltransferase domain-containing protein [Saprospiraceae bacterium]|nr:methyltransferase domain-containing protein [Saprospiraceae bacterium]